MISELRAKVVDFGLEPGFRGPHPRRAFARCLHASLDSGHHFRREGGVPEPFPARKKILVQGFLPGQARRRRRARRRHRSRGRRARARPRLGLAEAVLLSLLIDPLSSSLASDGGGLITLSINALSALRVERGRHRRSFRDGELMKSVDLGEGLRAPMCLHRRAGRTGFLPGSISAGGADKQPPPRRRISPSPYQSPTSPPP